MSNATTTPRQPGDPKRRRSRSGKNRSKQHHQDGRREGQQRGGQPRAEEFRPRSDRKPNSTPARKLNWFQRLLKKLGFYKEPVPPTPAPKAKTESRPPKSNIRNARSQERQENPPAKNQEPRQRREKSDRPRGGDRSSVESNRVYVGNLSYEVSEQDLQELFKGLGPVRDVEIVYNRSTHRSKGYGFVEMVNKDEAVRAVEVLHDQFFMGRKMVVSGAKSKGQDEREDQETRAERPARPVVLAPLPAVAKEGSESNETEATIQTIVETVTPLVEAPVVEAPLVEAPVVEAPVACVQEAETSQAGAGVEEVSATEAATADTAATAEETNPMEETAPRQA